MAEVLQAARYPPSESLDWPQATCVSAA